jgi:hypothetical protein
MPGWGTGSFENEDAQNFLGELKSLQIDDLRTRLAHAADQEAYLEAQASSIAIVATEVVARLLETEESPESGVPPQQILDWIKQNRPAITPDLPQFRDLATRAVERVRTNSELKDLWLEAEGLNEWSKALRDLEQRLTL